MISQSKRAEILTALNANPNASQVAKTVGDVSLMTVWKIAKEADIQLPRRGAASIPEGKREQIIAALKANPNAGYVAQTVGVGHATVWRIAKKADIKLSRRGETSIPEEKREQIIAALKINPRASQVAKAVDDVCISTVRKIAKESKIKLSPMWRGQNSITPEKREQITKALRINPSPTQVTKRIGGVSVSTVWLIAKEINIPLNVRGRRPIPVAKREAIVKAYTEVPNLSKVAAKLGVSCGTVRQYAKAAAKNASKEPTLEI